MTPAQWQRVRDLFEQAVDRDSSDARDWIAREAADDPAVAAEARSLLQHHTRAGSFLAEPVTGRVSHLFDDDPRFEGGAVIGPYTIVREVGRGGMGRVYLATDARLGRTVALKALPPSLMRDPAQRERLRREARAAAALTHPGICTIYALEELNGEVFIASEFVDGQTLREGIASGQRPSPQALLDSARELADALASAHAKGITHRDLKPENVIRSREGRLKILDFGLALIDPGPAGLEALPRVTIPGAVIGTPGYMSPEQLNGLAADARSDVFAFGVLVYEFATGVHPFDGDTALTVAARVLQSDPRPVLDIRPDIPKSMTLVIDRCLQKQPSDRFSSGAEIVQALDRADVPAHAPGVTRWWRTHQVVAIGLYFVACVLAWWIQEWQHGIAGAGFVLIGVAAMVVSVFRGHLLFTERMNRTSFDSERRRAEPITRGGDLLIALALTVEGLALASTRPVVGVLTIALAVAIALTRLVVEPATTRGAFGTHRGARG